MRKFIAAALASTMLLLCMPAGADNSTRTDCIAQIINDNSEIHILYNDKVVDYDDVKPVNTDGRVMIPFRAALESMGASVEYDDEQRLVTAVKDDTVIKFTLMDDTIYIDKNGEQSTVTMDVPMIIVSDRTLVPIRFMSNAFGMQVGWYDNASTGSQTVMIMDYEDYYSDVETIIPNLVKASTLGKTEINKESVTFDIAYTNGADVTGTLNGNCSCNYKDGVTSVKANLNLKAESASNVFEKIDISDLNAEIISNGGQLYIKTDAVGKIADAVGNETAAAAALLIDEDTWYRVDMTEIINSLQFDEQYTSFLNTFVTEGSEGISFEDVLTSGTSTDGDADMSSVITSAMKLDMMEQIDKYIKITEKDNGGYSISFDMTNEDFIQIIGSLMDGLLDDDTVAALKDDLSFSISADCESDGVKAVSDVTVSAACNNIFTVDVKLSDTTEKDEAAEDIQIPENFIDATDIVNRAAVVSDTDT